MKGPFKKKNNKTFSKTKKAAFSFVLIPTLFFVFLSLFLYFLFSNFSLSLSVPHISSVQQPYQTLTRTIKVNSLEKNFHLQKKIFRVKLWRLGYERMLVSLQYSIICFQNLVFRLQHSALFHEGFIYSFEGHNIKQACLSERLLLQYIILRSSCKPDAFPMTFTRSYTKLQNFFARQIHHLSFEKHLDTVWPLTKNNNNSRSSNQ